MSNRGYGGGYGGGNNGSNRGSNSGNGRPVAYTDGACSGNGQRNPHAGYGVYWGPGHPDNVSRPLSNGRQTNNRAEIRAAETAISQAKARGHNSVTVRTDSEFLYNSATKWMNKWENNGWQLSTGGEVKNREDFTRLNNASRGIDVNWEKVPAHSGNHGNNQADRLAREGIYKK